MIQRLLAEMLSNQSNGASLLIAKITLLLGLAWFAHLLMKRMNPQWHIYLWRFASMGIVLLLITTGFNLVPTLEIKLPAPPKAIESIAQEQPNVFQAAQTEGMERALFDNTTAAPESEFLPAPAIAPQTPEPPSVPLQHLLTALWACGTLIILGRMALGSWRLRCLMATTEAAPLEVEELGRQIEQQMGLRRHVALRVSPSIPSPIVTSQRSPVQVLPAYLCAKEHRAKLTAILAHELNHVRSKDLRWNHLLQLLEAAFWFHPLVWRIRAAHTSACELAADAASANLIGNARDYCRILATVALRAGKHPVVPGMAMARKSDVRQRLERLPETLKKLPIRRRALFAGITAACLVVLTIGGLQIAQAAEAESAPEQLAQQYQTAILAEEYEDAITLLWDVYHSQADLNSEERIAFFEQIIQTVSTTPTDRLQAFMKLFDTSQSLFVLQENDPQFVPLQLYYIRIMIALNPQKDDIGEALQTTMQEYGRAQASDIPSPTAAELALSKLLNQEYRYHTGTQYSAPTDPIRKPHKKAIDADSELDVAGQVIGFDGQPVSMANVSFGHFDSYTPHTTTDSHGHFRLDGLTERQWSGRFLTVYGDDITPYVHLLNEPESIDDLQIKLEAPQVFRVRIVDPHGNPVRASIQASYMKGKRSLYGALIKGATDQNGEWTWETAPSAPIRFDINGIASIRKTVELQANGEMHLITLNPELVIQGTVIDAETRKPIPNFTYQIGAWDGQRFQKRGREDPTDGTNGSFTQHLNWEAQHGHMLKIQAKGYTTAFMQPERDAGLVKREFALKPSIGIEGTLLQPDGSPAADTTILLLTKDHTLWGDLDNSVLVGSAQWQMDIEASDKTKTNAAGGFSLPYPGQRYKILVANDHGLCVVSKAEFEAGNKTLQLQPWANVEGQLIIEGKPAGGETVLLSNPPYISRSGYIEIQWQKIVKTDSDGNFSMKRIPAGIYRICRLINNTASTPATAVDAMPGKTVQIVLQNHGRTVQGQIDWSAFTVPLRKQSFILKPAHGPFLTDYRLSDDEANESVYQFWKSDAAMEEHRLASQVYTFTYDDDGHFVIPDVAPGTYELNLRAQTEEPKDGTSGYNTLGGYAMIVEVPALDGAPETPIELGEIKIIPQRVTPLAVGDSVPNFEFELLDGTTHHLHDFLGKPILLSVGGGWMIEAMYREQLPPELELNIVQISGGRYGKKDPNKHSNFETGFIEGFVMPMQTNLDYLLGGGNHTWRFYLINEKGIVEQVTDNNQKLADLF